MKATDKMKMEARIKQKIRTLIGSVTHTQNVADQMLVLLKSKLTEDEQNESDVFRVTECLSCACEEALQVLFEELKRGTRLHEILTQEASNIQPNEKFDKTL